MSAFVDLEAAVVSALTAAPALAGGHVARGRELLMPMDRSQQIDVALVASRGAARTLGGDVHRWETVIALRLRGRAVAGTGGAAAIDTLLSDTFARMAAATPPAGAARWALQPDIQWSVEEADRTLVEAQLTLRVDHFTGGNSLTAAP